MPATPASSRWRSRRARPRSFAPVYDTLADVYDWLVPEALVEPEGSVAAFEMVVGEFPAGAREKRKNIKEKR